MAGRSLSEENEGKITRKISLKLLTMTDQFLEEEADYYC